MLSIFENQKGKLLNTNLIRFYGVWQLIDQEKIHNQCLSNDSIESTVNFTVPYFN